MLKGLEITEINLEKLERTLRIDSEFYKRENLSILEAISGLSSQPLTNYLNVSDGNHLSISDYFSNEGVPYYRGGDIYNFFIEHNENPIKIPEIIYNSTNMKRSQLRKGDVLVSIVGAIIGNLALVKKQTEATCSCKLAILRPYNIKSEVAAIFLQSKYGQNQIQKFRRGTGQTGLILEDFDQLLIPSLGKNLSEKIESTVDAAYIKLEESQSNYSQAEQILLDAVGVKNFQPTNKNINIKKLSQSFVQSGRLDSEYYLPKYEEVISKIKMQAHKRLIEIVSVKKSVEPGSAYYSEEGIPFLRVSDYNKYGYNQPELKLNKNFEKDFPDFKLLKPKKDTILLSKDGSVGVAYKLEDDLDLITSGAILHLKVRDSKEILPDYLTIALNSQLTQMQAERDAGGSIILHWRVSEIENVLIPVIDYKLQQQISALIQQSFKLKQQSKELLHKAKLAVEIAIEHGEDKGMELLK